MIGFISKTGTSSGPCTVDCRHGDCAQQRFEAYKICPLCHHRIGYDTSFYRLEEGKAVHVKCKEEADARK